jgi:hypothetical protein
MELAPTDIKGCIMTRVGILARALAFPVIQKIQTMFGGILIFTF